MGHYDFGHQPHNHVVYRCNYHIIWCTKYRRPVLDTDEFRDRLIEIAYEVSQELECETSEIEVMPDHVHMLISVPPKVGIAVAVRQIKGRTSRLFRQEFSGCSTRILTLWTRSYFCSIVGGAPIAVVKQHIKSQRNV